LTLFSALALFFFEPVTLAPFEKIPTVAHGLQSNS
jgi:hypothetical protein